MYRNRSSRQGRSSIFRQIEASGEPIVTIDPLEKLKGSVLWCDRPFDPAVDEDDWEVLR